MLKIENALPVPVECDICKSDKIELTTNDKLYGKKYGKWPYIYFCNNCKAAVGCHPNTKIPLGTMADSKTRRLRRTAHEKFDRLWKGELLTRTKAYEWLARVLQIEYENCHISWLTIEQLNITIEKSSEYFDKNYQKLKQKRIKKHDKMQKREDRERKQTISFIKRRRKK